MGTIVVNDTNIFIDLISVDLLDEFFSLPIDIHTTDFVINELTQFIIHYRNFKPPTTITGPSPTIQVGLKYSLKSITDSHHIR